jgi:hypothetical protein
MSSKTQFCLNRFSSSAGEISGQTYFTTFTNTREKIGFFEIVCRRRSTGYREKCSGLECIQTSFINLLFYKRCNRICYRILSRRKLLAYTRVMLYVLSNISHTFQQ